MNFDYDDQASNPNYDRDSFTQICERRLSRRGFFQGTAAVAVGALAGCDLRSEPEAPAAGVADVKGAFDFIEIEHGVTQDHEVAEPHRAEVLLRWGDALFEDSPEFDYRQQTAASQSRQFGFNNDYVGFRPLPLEAGQQNRGLLCVNHEYPSVAMMFADIGRDVLAETTARHVEVGQAAVGASVVEVVMRDGQWRVNTASPYNRRITALDTPISMSGPAAGHPRLRTSADPSGRNVIGTFNNCAGGMTPWGTYLTCEENFNFHFSGAAPAGHAEADNHRRYHLGYDLFGWGKHQPRFDLAREPNEPNRFGWVVEIDPMDPESIPKKRTALGRFKHEGAENVIAKDGRLVVYMGDDQRFEYVYKFVSRDAVVPDDPAANKDLLDHGILYVARFYDDGRLQWLPLTIDNPQLAAQFESQADILIEPRLAGDILGATPMDRPEDIVPNAGSGQVYAILTNNNQRAETNAANPRSNNLYGHIVEMTEADGDFAAESGRWELLVKCGNPRNPGHRAQWHAATSDNGWFASPDNGVVDPAGRLWVATDQGPAVPLSGCNDGLWALETSDELRGMGKMFYRAPSGAEVSGPCFTPDGENLFIAVQHPGDSMRPGVARVETARTRWPDFDNNTPPRPSVVVVQRKGGGKIA